MYRGMTEYFAGNHEDALKSFAKVVSEDDPNVRHQASWYEANAYLALNRPMDALIAFERLSSAKGLPFDVQAAAAYRDLCEALGINSSVGTS